MYPIPANATRIRYLESTGTQYIDTGIVPTIDMAIEVSLDGWNPGASVTQYLFGVHDTTYKTNVYAFGKYALDQGGYFRVFVNGSGTMATNVGNTERGVGTMPVGYVRCDSSSVTIDSTTYPYTDPPSTPLGITRTMYLMQKNEAGSINASRNFVGRLKGCSILDGSTLVRSFIPVRIGQTGYLFDRVSGQLFGNAGTGDFVLGPDTFSQGVVPTRMMAMGVRKKLPTTWDYVQDSAFLFFDGIENVGRGTHDGTATTWKNLVTGPDAEATSLGTGEWNADGFFFKDSGAFYIDFTSVTWPSGGFTIELAFSLPQAGRWYGRVIGTKHSGSNRRIMWQTNSGGDYGMSLAWGRDYADNIVFDGGSVFPKNYTVAIIGSTTSSSKRIRWKGADQTIYNQGSNYPQYKATGLSIGNEGDLARPLYGVVHAVRFHSRHLTNEELDANAALDRTRFGVT